MTAIRFRCRECAKPGHREAPDPGQPFGCVERVVLTGRQKRHREAAGGPIDLSREYKCLDCGHVGWSSHADLTTATAAT